MSVSVAVDPEAPDRAPAPASVDIPAQRAMRRGYPILLLFVLSIGLLLPMLIWGLPSTGDDSASHVRWQYLYARQMWAGDPFPRWLRDIADGFGSPVFFIYPPLPHYAAALLAPLSGSIEWVHHRLAIAIAMACFLGAVGAFTWLRQVTRDSNTALIGAMVYTLAPYHMFVDTYFRSAYAELWGMAWAPFAFAGMQLLTSHRRTGIALAILGISGLLLSHAPTALILVPLCLGHAGLLAVTLRRWDIAAWAGLAASSAALIAGLYLGTALTQQAYIHTSALYTGYYNFHNWLMFAPNPVSKRAFDLSGGLQAIMTLALALGALATSSGRDSGRDEWRRLALASVIGTCILSFMMTSASAVVWTLVPFAQKIQFPWRLQTAQTLLLALSAALFLRAARPAQAHGQVRGKRAWNACLSGLPLLAVVVMNLAMFHHAPSKFDMHAPVDTHETPEYTLADPIDSARSFAGRDKLAIGAGKGSLEMLRWEPRHIAFRIDAATTTDVLARQFHYTGWTCRASGASGTCQVLSNKVGDIVRVRVGPGAQRIDLFMPETVQESAGKRASILGLCLAAVTILAAGRRRR